MPPGTMGTPAAVIRRRLSIFEPIAAIAAEGGPMKAMPRSSQRRANPAFSDRKP